MLSIEKIQSAGYSDVEEPFSQIFFIKNYLDNDMLDEVKKFYNSLSEKDWSKYNNEFSYEWQNKFYKMKDADLVDRLQKKAQKIIDLDERNLSVNAFSQLLRQYHGTKMTPHVDMHHITEKGETIYARYSLVLYLNDDYSGGNIEFNRIRIGGKPLSIKPPENSLLIFPGAEEEYLHRVDQVTSGNRYCLPGFCYENWPF